ncbi:hypothetical protein TYRP_012574 [Tyrophagus putrescentiae]|nr:hypothetical protein TYRP_012574 [Tyrophagus putrescentiae]
MTLPMLMTGTMMVMVMLRHCSTALAVLATAVPTQSQFSSLAGSWPAVHTTVRKRFTLLQVGGGASSQLQFVNIAAVI